MAALSANTKRAVRNKDRRAYAHFTVGTAATIYQGALVSVNTLTGRIVPATAVRLNRKFVGMAEQYGVGITAATVKCLVSWGYEALVDATAGLSVLFIGCDAAIASDNQVTTYSLAGTAGKTVSVGECVQIEGGDMWVRLREYTGKNV